MDLASSGIRDQTLSVQTTASTPLLAPEASVTGGEPPTKRCQPAIYTNKTPCRHVSAPI
jgi:hypothetical protein